MARDLSAIIQELDAGYNPGRQAINQKLAELPGQADAQINGLKAQEADYFQNTILGGARQRGLGFSGIPDGERARFGASTFLPAVAKVQESQNAYKGNLVDALNNANLDQRNRAQGIYQTELTRDEQARQFDEQQAASSRARASAAAAEAAQYSYGDLGNLGAGAQQPVAGLDSIIGKVAAPVPLKPGQTPYKPNYDPRYTIAQNHARNQMAIATSPLGVAYLLGRKPANKLYNAVGSSAPAQTAGKGILKLKDIFGF